eukprot:TRINITY_DN12350_c0_g3_i3.p1 TRINITY_DN12350_c0_g3~~TRINITY_DN12350_c0_g3_i3.p1  ORF type:complete len:741 (+),score=250.66 TRINITY_DN12350_c0_g3_i3:107-2329(+)
MSWLRNTISKVREKGEALKDSEALRNLKEKTSNVVSNAAQQVKKAKDAVKGSGPGSASELQAQLEQKARITKSPPALVELHRTWAQCLAGKEGYKSDEADRLLSFKEVLLRSKALELTIETIAADPALRLCYAEPPAGDDKTSPVAALYAVLSRTLSCPVGLWSEMLRTSLSDDGFLCTTHIEWVTGAICAMKADWQQEALYSERRELALRAEYLRQELKQPDAAVAAKPDGDAPTASSSSTAAAEDERHCKRVQLSSELLRTYQAVRKNLEEAQAHRQQVLSTRESDLALIAEQISSAIVGLQSSSQSSSERQKHLESELQQSHDSFQTQLQVMSQTRETIDKELEELEVKKRELRMELDEVSRKLDEARTRQREHMENCDKQRQELDSVKSNLKMNLNSQGAVAKNAEHEQAIVAKAKELVRETEAAVKSSLGSQMEELGKKQTQFNEHFQHLMTEHLVYAQEQSKASPTSPLRERLLRQQTDLTLHLLAASPWSSSVGLQALRAKACGQDGPEGLPAAERAQVHAAAVAARDAFGTFRQDYGSLLTAEAASTAQQVEEDHVAVLAALEPLMQSVPDSTPAAVVEDASEAPAPASAAVEVAQQQPAGADLPATTPVAPTPTAASAASPPAEATAAAAAPADAPAAAEPTIAPPAAAEVAEAQPAAVVPVESAAAPAPAPAPEASTAAAGAAQEATAEASQAATGGGYPAAPPADAAPAAAAPASVATEAAPAPASEAA